MTFYCFGHFPHSRLISPHRVSHNFALLLEYNINDNSMQNGLDILNDVRAPLNILMNNFVEIVAERVVMKMKAGVTDKPKYYTQKKLCEMLYELHKIKATK